MTTSHSPLRVLKSQADRVAQRLKAAERGDTTDRDAVKFTAARARDSITFGVAMDDKVFKIAMTWAEIKATSEVALAAYILKLMQGHQSKAH